MVYEADFSGGALFLVLRKRLGSRKKSFLQSRIAERRGPVPSRACEMRRSWVGRPRMNPRSGEEARLAESLDHWKLRMPDDPLLARVLRGRSPAEVAHQVVAGSKLADVSVRRLLAESDLATVEKSDDPMIELALMVDPAARSVRKINEDQVEGVIDAGSQFQCSDAMIGLARRGRRLLRLWRFAVVEIQRTGGRACV